MTVDVDAVAVDVTEPVVVDRAALRAVLDGTQPDARALVRDHLSQGCRPPVGASLPDQRAWTLSALRGIQHLPNAHWAYPVEAGGRGDQAAAVYGFTALGWGDASLSIKAGVHWGLYGGAVMMLGTEKHYSFLRDAVGLDVLGGFAMTEASHGSDVQSLQTKIVFDSESDELVVTTPSDADHKTYIGNAAQDANVLVVFGRLEVAGEDHGIHAAIVPVRDQGGRLFPGVRVEDHGSKGGLQGVDNGRVWFDHVRVPRSNLLDRYGSIGDDGTYESPIENPNRRFFTMLGALVQGRVCVAGAATHAAEAGLTIALRYALQRRQFPRGESEGLLLDYGSHQRRLLPLLARTVGYHFAQQALTEELVSLSADESRQGLETKVAAHKAVATAHALRVLQECRESCGGAGFMEENLLTRMRADMDVYATFEGDNTVLLQLTAKNLLRAYGQEFKGLNVVTTLRFAAGQVLTDAFEHSGGRGAYGRIKEVRQNDDDVRSRSWQHSMLLTWEERLLFSLARRVRAGTSAGRSMEDVVSDCQAHLVELGRAHGERLAFEAFAAAVDAVTDPGSERVLRDLLDLHVLSLLEEERGWFLEYEHLTPNRSRAIRRTVDHLVRTLRHDVLDVLDGLGVPEGAVDVPLLH